MSKVNDVFQAEYEVKEAESKLKNAKREYERQLVEETAAVISSMVQDGSELTEQFLDMALSDLSRKVRGLYEK